MLEGIDIAIGFQTLFTAVKKKIIHFYDIDQALPLKIMDMTERSHASISQRMHHQMGHIRNFGPIFACIKLRVFDIV
ncbi:hypothetical protein BGX24_004516 [Mortierella sp. AD032]|nr:hypothetical protein BGX24_004516 [Mortierella sp. AD032]